MPDDAGIQENEIVCSLQLVEAREGRAPSNRPIIDLLKQRRALGVLFNS